ncbi:MAG: DUF2834 domain-containing protein [Pseudomonadota bacterium]
MDPVRLSFLGLTLVALAFPVRRMVLWISDNGLNWEMLITELTASDPARAVTGAVLIASLAALIFMIGEAFVRRDWLSLICVPLTLIFGVAVGLPFYLYLRLRPLH